MDQIIKKYKLFWQEPVITEKIFYSQNKNDELYFGFPWATIIDSEYLNININYNLLTNDLIALKKPYRKYYTCCQHIRFKELIELFKKLNIDTIYTPHKTFFENTISNINIFSCPLYAVNIEDPNRNLLYKESKDKLITHSRPYLLSFQGAFTARYISNIRDNILNMKWPDNCIIRKTGEWHFQKDVYGITNCKHKTDLNKECEEYNNLLLNSRFSLCPSGTGPNSIRLWESLAFGSIPILLADTLELPEHPLWNVSIIRVEEKNLKQIPDILSKITPEMEQEMRTNCIQIYKYFKINYKNKL